MQTAIENFKVPERAARYFLALLTLSLVLAGCASTTKKVLKSAESVEVCLNGKCSPALGRFSQDELIGGIFMMLKANENSEAVLCASKTDSRECMRRSLRWFVQGGPMPGMASIKKPYLMQVSLDRKTSQIKFEMDATLMWIGTPVFCADGYTELTVSAADKILIESHFTCTWTAFPHVWNLQFSVGFIDFDNSILAGNYAISGGGLLTAGMGEGTFIMRLARKNSLVAQADGVAGVKAALISVEKLPPQLLVTPALKPEEKREEKAAADPAERKLWEAVSKKNTVKDYKDYLKRYPGGRFAALAKGNLQIINDREKQNKELGDWAKIKDSSDPKHFEAYLSKYPQGLFRDLAALRIQRLRAAGSEAAAMDADILLWNQVKGSSEISEIQVYLKHYPEGRFAGTARDRIEKLTAAAREKQNLEVKMWAEIKESRRVSDFQNFLQAFPEGIFAEIATSRMENLIRVEAETEELAFWNRIKQSSNTEDFKEYLLRYPDGQYADHARRLSAHLSSLKRERAELEFWEKIKDSENPENFANYLSRYPKGRFSKIARQRHEAALQAKALARIEFGNYYALVIGNNEYQHLRKLKTAANDARAVGSLLDRKYGFKVTYLINAGRRDIFDALSRLRRSLTNQDNLLIYFAGHGWLDKEAGRGYWLPVDSEQDSPANWISTGDITDFLKAMDAKHVMVVADSCYSGTLSRAIKLTLPTSEYLQRMAVKRARVVLTSGGVEPVLDDGSQGHSVFAKAFLDALKKNQGVLEGTRLFNQLRRPVILNAPQTPEYSDILYAGHDGGDFLFVSK
ncbi:MAG: caspase family protein [Desulfobacterales bacterium]|jgi:outer membrane protein assembly factor BamD (BamD/ComL family)